MATPHKIRAIPRLMQHLIKLPRAWMKGSMRWMMRVLLLIGRRQPQAGFVLPTTALLLLVVTLTVGAIGYRTYTRTQETIGERQQRVIYNAATPAIDRARAKLEFLFDPLRDPRAGGVPSQRQLLGMMLNDGLPIDGAPGPQRFPTDPTAPDPYTLPGEQRLDLNNDGRRDNAWRYPADTNGDGQNDATVVYSILMTAPPNNAAGTAPLNPLQDSRLPAITQRADRLQIRNAPLSNTNQANAACQRSNGAVSALSLVNGDGWFPDPNNRTKLRKNFQVNAYVVPNSQNGTVTTLEFQQDREATQGFKWAAWFRNDIELFPGPAFNWNGAMHTEGNFILGGNSIRTFLVSSQNSCIFDKSELTVARRVNDSGVETFAGQFIVGITRDNSRAGNVGVDVDLANLNQSLTETNDSVNPGAVSPNPGTTDFTLEPVILQTQDDSRSRGANIGNPQLAADAGWVNRIFNNSSQGRLLQSNQPTPYLDDLYRADNRLGPKPRVGRSNPRGVEEIEPEGIGQPIPTSEVELIRDTPPTGGANSEVGLDGYWERRSRLEGLRLIVGQRLELGDPAGWGGPSNASGTALNNDPLGAATEPLRPYAGGCAGTRCNEQRQRRTLLDNLSAVQSTAVYHARSTSGGDFPLACLATTVHPGTPGTLDRSATFENLAAPLQGTTAIPGYTNQTSPMVISDFFRGRGTNGWEFETHALEEFRTPTSPLMNALRNLANFAGDPAGGAPSFPPPIEIAGEGQVHPYPSMAMWGDFSMLRRVLSLYTANGYDALSPADKSTLHTAACTLGMLAYNVDYLENLNYDGIPAATLGNATPATSGSPASAASSTPAVTLAGFNSAFSTADDIRNAFSGLRGRIRLLNVIINTTSVADARSINDRIRAVDPLLALPDPNVSGTSANSRILQTLSDITNAQRDFVIDTARNNNPEFYVRLLERWRDDPGVEQAGTATRASLQNDIYLAQLIITKEQVARDRQYGFLGAYAGNGTSEALNTNDILARGPIGRCFDWSGASDPLASLCSRRPRYPILYSLFSANLPEDGAGNPILAPTVNDAYTGAATDNFLPHTDLRTTASVNNRRVRDFEDRNTWGGYIITQNATVNYAVVRPQDVALRPRRLEMPGSLVALGGVMRDRSTGTESLQNWLLPRGTGASAGFTPNGNDRNRIKVCSVSCSYPASRSDGTGYPQPITLTNTIGAMFTIPFKDSAFFNGREMMTVRSLDLDLDLLRNSQTSLTGDYWLPREGIVYAFREDAVSEADVVRPARDVWDECRTQALMQATAECRMDTYQNAYLSTDPPLNAANRITPKPVDYQPDPDRRVHGFRLKQGVSLVRGGSAANETKSIGISFISPNPAYVLGDFNLHRTFGASPAPLEEFTVPLADNYGNFYTRGSGGANGTLEGNFAQMTTDQWRPSEILADAVTLLSSNFCDGSIQDTLTSAGSIADDLAVAVPLQARYGCGTRTTSFLNQNRPRVLPGDSVNTQRQVRWVTANISDSYPLMLRTLTSGENPDLGDSPLLISRAGMPVQWSANDNFRAYRATDGFYASSRNRPRIDPPANTRVNTILVSGLVPTRTNQPYGGLHNFPRFLEDWSGRNLFFSGAFLQLNFSTYATAPFDLDAWEPGAVPAAGTGCTNSDTESREDICYYGAPNRRWGYDPALQYVPPAPVAQRFQQPETTRSEFYSEPPANDPYIARLRNCVTATSCVPSGT
ncbi:hormogonium polysaccharide biosynthesis protein HpsA [Leptolyngbya ohadii]|uniref:hormogonium polysaccharide biosynthesis protein HpsA n=1 Tax=Leptolyngbya ohadii TaxID=1962290 RepID=UPI000B5A1A85|nr:hormogonium polysaccharide biosynthesis protein HpsA [Leptolyngbya ohadii]